MAPTNACPKCGAELAADAPAGICPKCLLQAGLDGSLSEAESAAEDQTLPTNAQGSAASDSVSLSGTKVRYFGDYELLDEIARGGMGVVYKARQVNLNRIVALKMILSGQLAGEDEVKRFYAEAEAAAKLDHPNIVPIFEIGQHDGQHYFSMSFVEGESLAHKVADGPIAPREAAELVKKIAVAIAYAHAEGVIHRDLKPGNVLMDRDGEPRITDFGLAKRVEGDSDLTSTGQVVGTPSYMPPEQARGKLDQVGPPADVYAAGGVLYCLLTARPPFQAANPLDTLLQVLEKDPLPARDLVPQVPRDLETICLKCLKKEPRRRYGSAGEFAEDLQRFLDGEPVKARPISRPARLWRWSRRNPWPAGVLITVATLVVLVSVMATVRYIARARLEATARSFVDLLVQGDFVEATKRFDEAMKKEVPAESVEASWKQATGGLGTFKRQRGSVGIERIVQYDVVYVPCLFERSEAIVKVVLDREKRITGYSVLQGTFTQGSKDAELTKLKALATTFIDHWAKEEFDQARKDLDSTMTRLATPRFLRENWTSLVAGLGTFQQQRVIGTDEYLGYDRVYVERVFEKGTIVFQVVFNSEKQITGLDFQPESVILAKPPDGSERPNSANP